jgi:hypothetical protein
MVRFFLRAVIVIVGLAAAAACRDSADGPPGSSQEAARPTPPDSLVARHSNGAEIWFTLAREAVDSNGTRCTERGVEIRRGSTRLKVPLLYTGSAPVFHNDSTIRARLYNRCEPGDVYLVDMRSGQPRREHGRGKP